MKNIQDQDPKDFHEKSMISRLLLDNLAAWVVGIAIISLIIFALMR